MSNKSGIIGGNWENGSGASLASKPLGVRTETDHWELETNRDMLKRKIKKFAGITKIIIRLGANKLGLMGVISA